MMMNDIDTALDNGYITEDVVGYIADRYEPRVWNLVNRAGEISSFTIRDVYEFELVITVGHKFHHRDPQNPRKVIGLFNGGDLPSRDVTPQKHLVSRPASLRWSKQG